MRDTIADMSAYEHFYMDLFSIFVRKLGEQNQDNTNGLLLSSNSDSEMLETRCCIFYMIWPNLEEAIQSPILDQFFSRYIHAVC